MSDKISELLSNGLHSRRKFLAGLGMGAGAAAIIGCGNDGGPVMTTVAPPTTTAAPAGPSIADVLNFALNLEYLEAEFYLRATTGQGLGAADIGASPGAVTGGSQVTFTDPNIKAYALEIAADEQAHVQYLRKAITSLGGTPVDRPAIDLSGSFNAAAAAAKIPGGMFNPFDSETDFILGAFIFEDVGVTAYNGAAGFLQSNKAVLQAAAAIHATEAYHAAEIRTLLVYMDSTNPDNPNGMAGLLTTAGLISALRGAASSAGGGIAAETAPDSKHIVACDMNSLAYHRDTNQVLDIVYLNATGSAASKGGFYPNGMNGNIKASTK